VESARQSFTIIDQDLLAQAKRSLEATQAAYAAGRGDAVGLLDALLDETFTWPGSRGDARRDTMRELSWRER
jgi:hypothetical protein